MDYYFKKFSARQPQDVQFEQAKNMTSPNNSVYNNDSINDNNSYKKVISPRKKVNVVSFISGEPNKESKSPSKEISDNLTSPVKSPEFKVPQAITPNTEGQLSKGHEDNFQNRSLPNAKKDRRVVYNPRSWQHVSDIETKITIKPLNESSKGPTITKTIRTLESNFKSSEFDNFPSDDLNEDEPKLPLFKSKIAAGRASKNLGNKVTFADQPELKRDDKKIMVNKNEKDLFKVVKKTDNATECQNKGTNQHSNDDLKYLIEGIGKENNVHTRALSILTLANRCIDKNFRKYLKPNKCLSIITEKLDDAYYDFSLGLTSACLIYIISRERDPSQFSPDTIDLMTKLLTSPMQMTTLPVEETSDLHAQRTDSLPVSDNKAKASSLFSTSIGKFNFASRRNPSANGANLNVRLARESEKLRTRVKTTLELIRPVKGEESGENDLASDKKATNLFSSAAPIKAKETPLSRLKFKHIDIEKPINAKDLIIESLINIGLRKTPSKFKAVIREKQIMDQFADEIANSVDYLKDLSYELKDSTKDLVPKVDECSLEKLKRVFHYTRFLENMTYLETDNQTHLVRYQDGMLIKQLVRIIKICSSQLPKHPSPSKYLSQISNYSSKNNNNNISDNGQQSAILVNDLMLREYPQINAPTMDQSIILDCLTRTYRLMVNLSQNEFVSHILNGVPNVLEVTLDVLLHTPNRLPETHRFDILVLTLCTLVNQVQHFPENKSRIVHLELTSVRTKEEDDIAKKKKVTTTSALPWDDKGSMIQVFDEIISLFLYRDELVKSHDFEKDDGSKSAEDDGSVKASTDASNNAKDSNEESLTKPGETIEEAGLKWRLVSQNSNNNNNSSGSSDCAQKMANSLTNRSSLSKRKLAGENGSKSKKRKLKKSKGSSKSKMTDSDDDEEPDIESAEEDSASGSDDDSGDDDSEGGNDEDGVDVEFVTETKEEKDRLKEQMSSAHQHMEDSVVAAYVALLLGSIIQTSSRYTEKIRKKLPDGKFRPMAILLAKLCSFLSLTQNIDSTAQENISRVIKNLESLDTKSTSNN